jgi:hypothetical protein
MQSKSKQQLRNLSTPKKTNCIVKYTKTAVRHLKTKGDLLSFNIVNIIDNSAISVDLMDLI